MERAILTVSMSERDLRAGTRVLRALLHDDHPAVQWAVTKALADHGKHEALGCAQRMYAAMLAVPDEPSRWERCRAAVRRFFAERRLVGDYRGRDAL